MLQLNVNPKKVKGLCMKNFPSNLKGFEHGQFKYLRHKLTNYDQLWKSGYDYNQLTSEMVNLVKEVYPFLTQVSLDWKQSKK